ncbi:hypothetical protein TSAR_004803 [Trichomalopsis sarcophagae]|uniref:Poly A polymerase head domain-containing protein n=1 Tax=Trichomalopsis sarcophagae TaxID=543379 RepID=A0A232ELV3_9HYME|nr:hypothetical protein TSAR_004803 [Trichomalopsis sarcophagae]
MLILNTFTKKFECLCKREHINIIRRLLSENQWIKRKMPNENIPPHRSDPVIKTLDSPEFKSIFTPELNTLADIFKRHNYELRVAGGAVRDILMGKHPKDLDFATTATPVEMKEMFTKEEVRMINCNGEKHGTITSRINDKENFEVTTLRVDVVTDGRHADVLFTTDWLLDASRRDLTINSMFLDVDGKVYDYFYGYDDLMKRRVAFVGEPAQRICEDFLRIFRYFRFYGRIADVPDNHDEKTITAIKENVKGLEIISGERIWSEWSKILAGNFHRELTLKLIECGCSKYMGLPENLNLEHFNKICLNAQKNNVKLRPITLIAALLRTEEEVLQLFMRLRFPNFDRNLALFIVQHREEKLCENPLKPFQRVVLKTIGKVSDVREFVSELLRYKGSLDLLEEFEKWDSRFPINGGMVKPYVENPKVIGEVINRLKDIWLDSNCEMPVEKLQKHIPDIAAEASLEHKERVEKFKADKEKRRREKKKSVSN